MLKRTFGESTLNKSGSREIELNNGSTFVASEIKLDDGSSGSRYGVTMASNENNIVNNYDDTIFIEEALHRLVEIHYHIGLEEEAKKYAKILVLLR